MMPVQAAPSEKAGGGISGGDPWQLGPFDSSFRLLKITVWSNSGSAVVAIQFSYKENGEPKESRVYGGTGGATKSEFTLDGKEEALTKIIVWYLKQGTGKIVAGLYFETPTQKSAIYGQKTNDERPITPQVSIKGFVGSESTYNLDALDISQ